MSVVIIIHQQRRFHYPGCCVSLFRYQHDGATFLATYFNAWNRLLARMRQQQPQADGHFSALRLSAACPPFR